MTAPALGMNPLRGRGGVVRGWAARVGAAARPVVIGARWLSSVSALLAAAAWFAARPWTWGRVYREQVAEQTVRAAIDGCVLVAPVAMILGAFGVSTASAWLSSVGQGSLLPALVVRIFVIGVVPLVAGMVVIGRSGCPAAAHLATLTIGGQVRALDAQGIDPFCFFVAPRILAFAFAGLVLTVVFAVVSMASGYVAAASLGVLRLDPVEFTQSLLENLTPVGLGMVVLKAFVPGAVAGAICCLHGLEPVDHPAAAAYTVRLSFSLSLIAVIVTMGVIVVAGVLVEPFF